MRLHLAGQPLHRRPFYGLGVEADGVLYNENNEKSGVTEEEVEKVEGRIVTLRPSIARMFFQVQNICAELDPDNLDPDAGELQRNLRMLSVLREAGASVNAVLFQPFDVATERLPDAVRCMLRILRYLRAEKGCDHIRWLTLYNEPESAFPHDSDLVRRVFSEKKRKGHHRWEDYVYLNHLAQEQLEEQGLYPDLRLVVADTVWGAGMRRERMQLSADAFGEMDVTYGYHNYNPEAPRYYETAHPDFRYDGMGAEAAEFRDIVGPEPPLMVWECNLAGTGFGTYYPGVDEHGCCVTETRRAGARLTDKIFDAIRGGVDGFCLWCVGDMYFYGDPSRTGVMRFGLWRYKYEGWRVRPFAHYYAALCRVLQPKCSFRKIHGLEAPVNGLAWERNASQSLALVNNGPAEKEVALEAGKAFQPDRQLRIRPDDITPETKFPLDNWEDCETAGGREMQLEGYELRILSEGADD